MTETEDLTPREAKVRAAHMRRRALQRAQALSAPQNDAVGQAAAPRAVDLNLVAPDNEGSES